MSVRNLDKLFQAAIRAGGLIDANPQANSVGGVVARNLRRAGFAGELLLVNPHHQTIDGLRRCARTSPSLPTPLTSRSLSRPPRQYRA